MFTLTAFNSLLAAYTFNLFTTTALCIFLGKNLEKCYDTMQSTALCEISITCAVNAS